MAFEKRNGMGKLKGMAMAAGLGLTALLSGCATSGYAPAREHIACTPQTEVVVDNMLEDLRLKPSATGLGYRSQAASMSYKQVIADVKTPEEAQFYLDNYLQYESDKNLYGHDYHASFKKMHEKGKDDCDGKALAAAALLSDNGYKPLILQLKKNVPMYVRSFAHDRMDYETANNENAYHAQMPFQDKQTGKWGCVGVEYRKAKFDTLESLAKDIGYELDTSVYPEGVKNLDDEYERGTWIGGNGNLLNGYESRYDSAVATSMMNEIRRMGTSDGAKQMIIENSMKQKQFNSRKTAEYNYGIAQNALRDLAIKAQSATNVAAK